MHGAAGARGGGLPHTPPLTLDVRLKALQQAGSVQPVRQAGRPRQPAGVAQRRKAGGVRLLGAVHLHRGCSLLSVEHITC